MWISRYFTQFILFSFLGWVWETIYCTVKNGKWANRGFLFGPICPIYGVGATIGVAVVDILSIFNLPMLKWWQVFIFSFFASMVLEYFTSWALEKLFHAYWWDYSNVPLNIKGRVSVPTSCGFGLAGLLVVYVLAPLCLDASKVVPEIVFELLALILAVLFTIDMTLTISTLTNFDKRVSEIDSAINDYMTELVANMYKSSGLLHRHTLRRVKGFRYPRSKQVNVQKILEKIKSNIKLDRK